MEETEEAVFYNALNIACLSGYASLRKQYAQHGNWKRCWQKNGVKPIDPEKEWSSMQKHGIGLVLESDPAYPPLLREIPQPPLGIYYRGNLAACRMPAIAIVGTRKATIAGKFLAREFAAALTRAGCAVASGLAFGIDAEAHAGTLEARGATIAVLANGLGEAYPASHDRLAKDIIEGGGALLSEYPLGSPPLAYHFLERNR